MTMATATVPKKTTSNRKHVDDRGQEQEDLERIVNEEIQGLSATATRLE